MINSIKIILAFLLVICLADMPYGYYEFVRFSSMIGFAWLAYKGFRENESRGWIYVSLAILFQPLYKIALGRDIWQVVDVVVAIGLILSVGVSLTRYKKTN